MFFGLPFTRFYPSLAYSYDVGFAIETKASPAASSSGSKPSALKNRRFGPGDLSFAKAVKRSGRLYFGLVGLVCLIEETLPLTSSPY